MVHLGVRKRGWRWVLAAMVVVLALVVAGWYVYVRPPRDEVHPADVVLVLGGPGVARYSVGLEYALEGYAPPRSDIQSDRIRKRVAHRPVYPPAIRVRRFVFRTRSAYDTGGKRASSADLRSRRGWQSVIVVTQTPPMSLEHATFSDGASTVN